MPVYKKVSKQDGHNNDSLQGSVSRMFRIVTVYEGQSVSRMVIIMTVYKGL
jgi:ribosomal protein S15P/S13E